MLSSGPSAAPRGVSFDAAGTLLALAEPVEHSYARVAREHGIDAQPGAVRERFPAAFGAAPPLAFDAHDLSRLEQCERNWWRGVVATSLAVAPRTRAFEACFDALYAYFADPRAWRLYADVVPTLDRLARADVPMVVLSNFDSRLPALLEGLGVAGRFEAIAFSSAIGYAKPDAGAFEAARSVLDLPMQCMAHIGDSRSADLEGGRAAGCTAWLLDRDGGQPAGASTVSTLAAMADLLGA